MPHEILDISPRAEGFQCAALRLPAVSVETDITNLQTIICGVFIYINTYI